MSFEIQVHTTTMTTLIETALQQGFRTTCLPSADPFYVDHVDVVKGKTTVTATAAGIDFVVTVDVFVVQSSAVLAAPNGVPSGATIPAGEATITLQLSVAGTTVTFACTNVDLGAPGQALGNQAATLEQQIKSRIGTVGSLDMGPLASTIGLPAPSSSSLEIVGQSILIRFDPSGAGAEHIQTGQDWCLFADANTMAALVSTKLDTVITRLGTVITSHTTAAAWLPLGSTPAMTVFVDGKAQVPDPFAGNVHVGMEVVFGLLHTIIVSDGIGTDLVLDVVWVLNVNLGDLVPGYIDDMVVKVIKAQVDPTKFGATAVGPQEFQMLFPLPTLAFGGAVFEYQSIVGLSVGMVLGGPVTLPPDPGTGTLSLNVVPYPDSFSLTVDCSKGSAATKPTLGTVTTSATASFDQAGAICDIHLVSPASPPIALGPYLTAPANGTVVESGLIAMTLPGTAAWWLSLDPQPIQLWVQSARGVRLLDLGTPPSPQLDANGDVTNYKVMFINDCPTAVDPWFRFFHMYNPRWGVDPPESWTERLAQVERFETVLVDVRGLEAGALVQFEQPVMGLGVASVFAADAGGQAVVVALLAARSHDEGARLSVAGRQRLADVAVSTAVFERVALLDTPSAVAHQLTEEAGAALVTSTFANGRTQTVRVDGMRIPTVVGAGRAAIIGGAVGEPEQADDVGARSDIPSLVALHPVSGFEGSGLQVAELEDGAYVVVREECGRLRVTGTVAAWPRMPAAGEGWAISSARGDRVAIYAVTRVGVRLEQGPAQRDVDQKRNRGHHHGCGHHCGCD